MGNARRLTHVAGWSASHPRTTIAAWIGAVVVLMVTGHLAGTLQLKEMGVGLVAAAPPLTRVGA
jgi:hypothetical protein